MKNPRGKTVLISLENIRFAFYVASDKFLHYFIVKNKNKMPYVSIEWTAQLSHLLMQIPTKS